MNETRHLRKTLTLKPEQDLLSCRRVPIQILGPLHWTRVCLGEIKINTSGIFSQILLFVNVLRFPLLHIQMFIFFRSLAVINHFLVSGLVVQFLLIARSLQVPLLAWDLCEWILHLLLVMGSTQRKPYINSSLFFNPNLTNKYRI